jgi:hypothetical protein
MLTQPEPKQSQRQQLLGLAMQLLSLSMMDETNEAGYAEKDGTGPEVYVAPRWSPSP